MPISKLSKIRLGAIPGLAVWRNRPIRYLVLCGVLLIAAIVIITVIIVSNLRDRALFNSERELKNTALILAEQLDLSFQSIELVQNSVVAKIRSRGIASSQDLTRQMSGQDVNDLLRASISGLAQLDAIAILNADGKLLNYSHDWPIPAINNADRDYFKVLKSNAQLKSFISVPVLNRINGRWTLYLAHKLTAENGEFLGVILGAIDLSYFEKIFGSILLGDGSSITLYRSDGVLLARYPRAERVIGKSFKAPFIALGDHSSGTTNSLAKWEARIVCWPLRGLPITRYLYRSPWTPTSLSPIGKRKQEFFPAREVLQP